MNSALLIDLWFTLTGAAAILLTAAQLVATVLTLGKKS